jgi:uncharacterized membrane protein YphA (DoxX/SURF4 family)
VDKVDLYMATLELFARAVCAGALVVAGALKLRDAKFADAIQELTGLSSRLAAAIGRVVPPLEILIGLLLVAGPFVRLAAAAGGSLLLAFASILTVNVLRGRRAPCACFGSRYEAPASWGSVLRTVALAAAIQPALWIDRWAASGLPAPIAAAAISSASILVLVAFLIPQLRAALVVARTSPKSLEERR